MHIYIIFAHPSRESFSKAVLDAFTRGLEDRNHSYEIADLYEMGFLSEMDEEQYFRELNMNPLSPVPEDVLREQEKIDRADALVFIYPLWWSDCPAKMKGWFDRVLTHGYAYYYDEQEQRHTRIDIQKALVICSAGNTQEYLEETGIFQAMKVIMLNDRLLGVGVREARLEVLDGMLPGDDSMREPNLKKAYELAATL